MRAQRLFTKTLDTRVAQILSCRHFNLFISLVQLLYNPCSLTLVLFLHKGIIRFSFAFGCRRSTNKSKVFKNHLNRFTSVSIPFSTNISPIFQILLISRVQARFKWPKRGPGIVDPLRSYGLSKTQNLSGYFLILLSSLICTVLALIGFPYLLLQWCRSHFDRVINSVC